MGTISQTQLEESVIDSIDADMESVLDRLVQELQASGLLAPLTEARLEDTLRRAATAELHAGMRGWTLDRRLPQAPPAESGEFARRAARAGLPLTLVMRVYMVALNVYWEAIFDAILAGGADEGTRNELVRVGTRFFQRFMSQITTLAVEEHTDEHDRAVRRRALRRLATVRDVLAGSGSSTSVLGYDLRRPHLGLVATGARAEDTVSQVAADLGVASLVVPADDLVWAWVGAAQDRLQAVAAALEAGTDGLRIGAGRVQLGTEGFRVTHRQALAAHAMAVSLRQPLLRHQDIALEHLTGGDSTTARQFVSDELRALSAGSGRLDRWADTLHIYLANGQNGAVTAAALGVSARTVSHRIRRIESALGYRIAERAVELHTALRLRALFDRTRGRAAATRARSSTGASRGT